MNNIEKIHRDFSTYGQNAREWLRKCQLLLPLVAKYEVWKKKNFSSIYEYAAKLAGMSRTAVDEALWVLRKIEDKPALLALVEKQGIQKIKPVANIATLQDEVFWAEKIGIMAQKTLRTYVKEVRKNAWGAPSAQPERLDVTLSLKSNLSRKLEYLKKHAQFEEHFQEFLEAFERKITEQRPKAVNSDSRHIPMSIQRHVKNRTNGLCAYPGCKREATSLHHTQRWGLEKVHDPERLHALCTAHERLAHLGLIDHEEESPPNWQLRKYADLCSDKQYIDRFVALYRPT